MNREMSSSLINVWKYSFSTNSNGHQYGSSKETSSTTAKDMAPDKHSTTLLLIDVINHLD